MATAEIALILAIFSAVVALGSLTWQVASFLLSGSRVKVRMSLVVEPIDGSLLVTDRFGPGHPGAVALRQMRSDFWVELIRLEVTNSGRLPVSIMSSGLLLKCPLTHSPLWPIRVAPEGRPVSRKRGIVRSRDRLEAHGGSVEDFPIRLEPGESTHFIYDLWAVMRDHREERPKDRLIVVRGVVQPAGDRFRKSGFRRRWTIRHEAESIRQKQTTSLQKAYRGFWRVNGLGRSRQIDLMWKAGARALVEGQDAPTVAQRMSKFATDNQLEAAFEMMREYDP